MTSLEAFLLGAMQGITEFLPVSSSTHVAILEKLLKIPPSGKFFDVFLNAGTLLAIAVFFRQQVIDLILGAMDCVIGKKTKNRSFLLTILLSNLPALIIGAMLEVVFCPSAVSGIILSVSIILFSIILYFCDRRPALKENISRKDSLLVGLVQPLAFIPGVSRLGICLSMLRYLKYSREESFCHAMMLSIPPVFCACALGLVKTIWRDSLGEDWSLVAVGSFSSFIFGLPMLFLVTRFLQKHTLLLIILYRITLGLVMLTRELQ
jgi:undecaprenyl-diphosphatase